MSHVNVWAPRAAVETALAPLLTSEPEANAVGSWTAEAGEAYLVVAWSEPDGNTSVVVEAHEGDPEAEAQRVYDALATATSWQLELWDEDGSYVLAERDALATT